jgi:uncharacterized protein YcfJ
LGAAKPDKRIMGAAMIGNGTSCQLGTMRVLVTNGRTRTAEELADLAMLRILYIGDAMPPAIAEQAREFRDRVHAVVARYIREAVREEREACANLAEQHHDPELASHIRSR